MLRSTAGRFLISPALRAASRGEVESRALLFEQRLLAASSGSVPGVITGGRAFSTGTTGGKKEGAVSWEEAAELAIKRHLAIPPHAMDIMLTDINEEGLKMAADLLGVVNLGKASYPALPFPAKGRVIGPNKRLMINLVCGVEARPPRNVVFIVDTGSPSTFITPSTIEALLGSSDINIPSAVDVLIQSSYLCATMVSTPQYKECHFKEANVLGMPTLHQLDLSILINYRGETFQLIPSAELVKWVNSGGEKGGGGADFKSYPADTRDKRARRASSTRGPFNWGIFYVIVVTGSICTAALLYMAKRRREERDRMHKRMIGRANIGGEWELVNCVTGEVEGSKELAGNWLLIYFGFTHCPDICPEQIEKMLRVVDSMQAQKVDIPIVPLFLSVDPQRDSAARVKTYCEEFSPKLRGYTGSKEQVEKVTRAFRVYYSPGPKTEQALQGGQEDYIVDHTVVMYLVDPDGQFADYFGQNRNVDEIVNAIRMKQTKREVNAARPQVPLLIDTHGDISGED